MNFIDLLQWVAILVILAFQVYLFYTSAKQMDTLIHIMAMAKGLDSIAKKLGFESIVELVIEVDEEEEKKGWERQKDTIG